MTTTMTCPACGHAFETAARSNRTRCGSCRAAVTVPDEVRQKNGWDGTAPSRHREPAVLLVLHLDCGHVSVQENPGIAAADADDYIWDCEHCAGAERDVVAVLGALTDGELGGMSDEDIEAWAGSLVTPEAAS